MLSTVAILPPGVTTSKGCPMPVRVRIAQYSVSPRVCTLSFTPTSKSNMSPAATTKMHVNSTTIPTTCKPVSSDLKTPNRTEFGERLSKRSSRNTRPRRKMRTVCGGMESMPRKGGRHDTRSMMVKGELRKAGENFATHARSANSSANTMLVACCVAWSSETGNTKSCGDRSSRYKTSQPPNTAWFVVSARNVSTTSKEVATVHNPVSSVAMSISSAF
mmetsp:Transcript_13987/g.45956  ORF Transcript_13987/g.45956 Transcript_13987/m.45956 type:complete len:218 (+) Transcript_13987:498-1151(+)